MKKQLFLLWGVEGRCIREPSYYNLLGKTHGLLNFDIVLFKERDKEVKNEKYEKYRRKRKNYSGREVSPGAASGHTAPMTLMQAAHFHAAQSLLSRGWSRSSWVTTADPKQDPRPPSPILAVGVNLGHPVQTQPQRWPCQGPQQPEERPESSRHQSPTHSKAPFHGHPSHAARRGGATGGTRLMLALLCPSATHPRDAASVP